MEGWFKTHRKLLDGMLWLSEPFTRGQAWVDMIGLATHEYQYFYVRGVKVELNKGQIGWSEPKLSDRWKWSRTKLRRFLNDLEKEQQIIQHKDNVTQVITIVNYEIYQEKEQQTRQQKNSRSTHTRMDKNIDTNVSIWRENFDSYLSDCKREHNRVYKDAEFLKKMQHYYPSSNIKKSIELSFDYWKTEQAWELKKSKKTRVINWVLTIKNSIDMKRVPLTKEELATA